MFSSLRLRSLAKPLSRSMHAQREVMVSQTRDLLSNIALEDWTSRNVDSAKRSLLVLTNNITRARGVDIKATFFLPSKEESDVDASYLESLVLTSLPPDLLMNKPPLTTTNHIVEEGEQRTISVTLDVVTEVKTKTVLWTLETIGRKFLGDTDLHRIKLVRPDDGWFPGLSDIRAELERTLLEVEKMKKRSQPRVPFKDPSSGSGSSSSGGRAMQNSFGQ